MIGNEKRIFVGRNFSVFQNRARWPTSGGFVMLPDRAEPNIELRNAELPEDPSDLRPRRAILRQLTLRRTPRSQQARLDSTARTPHAAHALAYDGWLEGQLVSHHSLSRGNRARGGSKDQFFFVREPGLCVGHTLIGNSCLFVWFA